MSENTPSKGTKQRGTQILTWSLVIILLFSILGTIYIATISGGTTDPTTEFYILGSEENASNYPTSLTTGESGEFIIGITNNEDQRMEYTVRLVVNENVLEERVVEVADQNTWEDDFQFSINEEGTYRLEILLFIGDNIEPSAEPYRELHLWVTITDEETEPEEPIEIP